MAKFHVNPVTGNPGECSASAGRCPYGGDEVHGASEQEARVIFERTQAAVPATVNKNAYSQASRDLEYYVGVDKVLKEAEELFKENSEGMTTKDRMEAWATVNAIRKEKEEAAYLLESSGLGHFIPDDEITLRVSTMAQKIMLNEHLKGQISDGKWEKLQGDHWEVWVDATVIVDPQNVGRNFNAKKDNYQLNAQDVLSVISDRMVESVRVEDPSYDEAKMAKDLRELRKAFKTPRPKHPGATAGSLPTKTPVAPAPAAPKKAPAAPAAAIPAATAGNVRSGGFTSSYAMNMGAAVHANDVMVGTALAGPGAAKKPGRLVSKYQGKANPVSFEGDAASMMATGSTIIAGRADGTRVRAIAAPTEFLADPGDELGRPITFLKEQKTGDLTETDGLHIIGYRDSKGNLFGHMPNRKVEFFHLR